MNNKSNKTLLESKSALDWWITLLLNSRFRWVTIAIILLLGLAGIALPVINLLPSSSPAQSPAQQQIVSRAEYERLEMGMTLTDAQAMLGRAIEVNHDEATATYQWINKDGSKITAVFKGNRLVRKEQSGLK